MDELQTQLMADLRALIEKKQDIERRSREIERKGAYGSENLLAELAGKRLVFALADGRTIEGVLLANQMRSLKVQTDDQGVLVLNTLLLNTLTPAGGRSEPPPAPKKRAPKKGGRPS